VTVQTAEPGAYASRDVVISAEKIADSTVSETAAVANSGRHRPIEIVAWPSARRGFRTWRYDDLKRLVDVAGAAVLLVLLAPAMVLVAIAIRIESSGPVLYRAKRVGRDGRSIGVVKFRSMFVDAEDRLWAMLDERPDLRDEFLQTYKLREDPRQTRVGRFIRRTSLDEVPQFWNVLTGTMSLVGPRPVTDGELAMYEAEAGCREAYLSVHPGITGLWQVSGRSHLTYRERVLLDREYVANRCLRLDIKILLKTPLAVLSGDGAY
jgi:lipopolysaccharide/colanic/teichoic acid biosynthesis glycosyltransferase